MTDDAPAGRVAVVTGAAQGIGAAIARRLADAGTEVWMVARRAALLQEAADCIGGLARPYPADLTDRDARAELVDALRAAHGSVDVLVNNAGVIHLGTTEDATEDELEEQLSANVVAPYALTRACLPLLRAARGQIVFINSSAGKSAKPGAGQFSATQHATRAFADSLRAEVNGDGIRVTVVHPGRTASPRQQAIHEREGRAYCPERLVQADDVAEVVHAALTVPRTAEVTEISVRPMQKS
jgi:NADP-dependent 3-hydroxy acid dehydrogenase YdfG